MLTSSEIAEKKNSILSAFVAAKNELTSLVEEIKTSVSENNAHIASLSAENKALNAIKGSTESSLKALSSILK